MTIPQITNAILSGSLFGAPLTAPITSKVDTSTPVPKPATVAPQRLKLHHRDDLKLRTSSSTSSVIDIHSLSSQLGWNWSGKRCSFVYFDPPGESWL